MHLILFHPNCGWWASAYTNRYRIMLNISLISSKRCQEIHEKSLYLLENTGVAFHHEPALRLLKRHGASVDGKTARIPSKLVIKCLAMCPASFSLEARNPEKNVIFGQSQGFLVLPNLGPIFIQDADGRKRYGTMMDFINITRLSHVSPVVDVLGSCPIDTIDADPKTKFMQMVYQSCRYSDKPIMCCTAAPDAVERQLMLMELAFGQPGIMQEKVITGTSLSPLSPLAYSQDAAYAVMAFAKQRQMIIIAGAPMSGINAPVSIAGTSLVINVEFLAAMTLAQCVCPQTPVVYATTASASNLQNATYVTGIPETTLLNCFSAQMGRFYNVPTRTVGAATDAKTVDMQAGFEAMQTLLLAGLSGADAVYETLGVLESLMTISYEKFIIDQELISRVKQMIRGVGGDQEALEVQDIEEVGIGGNYLLSAATLKACRQRWSPMVSDRGGLPSESPAGAPPAIIQEATTQWRNVLMHAPESILDFAIDKQMLAYIETCH